MRLASTDQQDQTHRIAQCLFSERWTRTVEDAASEAKSAASCFIGGRVKQHSTRRRSSRGAVFAPGRLSGALLWDQRTFRTISFPFGIARRLRDVLSCCD